jgi:hypothetical protein
MTRRTSISERPRGSRIDDLGATHIGVSPEIERFQNAERPAPAPRPPLADSRGDAVELSHAWGSRPTGRF